MVVRTEFVKFCDNKTLTENKWKIKMVDKMSTWHTGSSTTTSSAQNLLDVVPKVPWSGNLPRRPLF